MNESKREQQIQAYRRWLNSESWSWFATLKITSGKPSVARANRMFNSWIAELRACAGGPEFRFARVLEKGGLGSNLHFHILIGGLENQRVLWTRRWARLGGEALIQRFDPDQRGILYMLKGMNQNGDLDMEIELPKKNSDSKKNGPLDEKGNDFPLRAQARRDDKNYSAGAKNQETEDEPTPTSIRLNDRDKTITITMPLEEPRPSASGKTLLIASTRGLKSGEATYAGKTIVAVASAFIFPTKKSVSSRRKSDGPAKQQSGKDGEANHLE